MKCSIGGKITRLPYVGTGDSEVLPWKQVLSKVEALIPMMQSRSNGGSLCKCCSVLILGGESHELCLLPQFWLFIQTIRMSVPCANRICPSMIGNLI